jgi:hypothetical protein
MQVDRYLSLLTSLMHWEQNPNIIDAFVACIEYFQILDVLRWLV